MAQMLPAQAEVTGLPASTDNGTPPDGRRLIRRLVRQPVTVACVGFLAALVLVALLAPWIAPYGEDEQNVPDRLHGISAEHWLGTDYLGRDVLSRLLFGARAALLVAGVPVLVACVIGTALGLVAGYRRGWWDRALTRTADIGDALPSVILALVIIAVLGPNELSVMIAIAMIFVTAYLRLARALVLSESQKLYVEAARISGLRNSNILFRQILPNAAGPLIVQTSIYLGAALLIEASLSFLGLDPSRATWGGMLSNATQFQGSQPLLPWPPGIAITLSVLAFNLLGDGLRDALAGEKALTPRALRRLRGLSHRGKGPSADPSPGVTGNPDRAIAADETERDVPLRIEALCIDAPKVGGRGATRLVDHVSMHVERGEVLGVVGESGSGKSMTALAALGLLPSPVYVASGAIAVGGQDVLALDEAGLRRLRGTAIGMIFQDPLTALSPVHTVETHLVQALTNHGSYKRAAARARAVELLDLVGIREPSERVKHYPHQLSGGMAQRVGIAMALAGEPDLLIADEATTALDMRVQRQILDLIKELQSRLHIGVLLITHDLGLAVDMCDRIVVMQSGRVVEEGDASVVLAAPKATYTRALLAASPVQLALGDHDKQATPSSTEPRGTARTEFASCPRPSVELQTR